jgi:hypothetical protein
MLIPNMHIAQHVVDYFKKIWLLGFGPYPKHYTQYSILNRDKDFRQSVHRLPER